MELVQSVLQHVVHHNAWRRVDAASRHLLASWSDLVCLTLTKRFPAVCVALEEEPGGPAAAAVELLLSAAELLRSADDSRCAPLLRCAHLVLERLVSSKLDASSLVSCGPSLLLMLLSVVVRSDRSDATRHFVFASLLAYLRLCRPGLRPSADLSLSSGNLAVLLEAWPELVTVLARDALGGSDVGRPQALALLEACLGAGEGAGGLLEASLFSEPRPTGLPAAVVSAVERTPRASLLLPPSACSRKLIELQAQLSFLTGVARFTPRGPEQLLACGAVSHLAGCQVLDALDGECSEPPGSILRMVLLPSLQLVATLLELLPQSGELAAQALKFCSAHHGAILRLLELELDGERLQGTQAAVRLLSRLDRIGGGRSSALDRFREALERLCWSAFEQEAAPGPASTSLLFVQALLTAHLLRLVVSKRSTLVPGGWERVGLRAGAPSLPLVARLVSRLTGSLFTVLRARHELATRLAAGRLPASELPSLAITELDSRLLVHALENSLEAVHSTLSTTRVDHDSLERLSLELVPVLDELARLQDYAFLSLVRRRLRVLLERCA